MRVYIPKELTADELKEHLHEEAFNVVMEYFKSYPMKTTFKVVGKKFRVTIRRFDYGSRIRYTITGG